MARATEEREPEYPQKLLKNNVTEGCWYCGENHRRSECPKLSAAIQTKGLRLIAEGDADGGDGWYLNLCEEDRAAACGNLQALCTAPAGLDAAPLARELSDTC